MGKKFSELERTSSLNNGDLFAVAQVDAQAQTGYKSKSTETSTVAQKLLKGIEFLTDLDTSDKTIIGAINEVAETLEGLYPIGNVSGPVANFSTELARLLEALKVGIVATQESGTPTPSSPKAISGWNEVKITKCRKNLLPNKMRQRSATSVNIGIDDADDSIFLKAGTYTLNVAATITISNAYLSGDNTAQRSLGSNFPITFTLTNEDNFKFWVNGTNITPSNITNFQLEVGSIGSSYEAYSVDNFDISLGDTYYGGYVTQDKAGHRQLVVTYSALLDMGDLTWANFDAPNNIFRAVVPNCKAPIDNADRKNGFLCSIYPPSASVSLNQNMSDKSMLRYNGWLVIRDTAYSDYTELATGLSGGKLIYELETPIVVDLPDGVPIETLIGVNNIFADSGDILECKYKDTIQHYIDTQIAATQALIL